MEGLISENRFEAFNSASSRSLQQKAGGCRQALVEDVFCLAADFACMVLGQFPAKSRQCAHSCVGCCAFLRQCMSNVRLFITLIRAACAKGAGFEGSYSCCSSQMLT